MNFSNWHQHSDRSWLDGMAKPADIAARCKELGMTHAMLTDHANQYVVAYDIIAFAMSVA